MPVIQIHSSIDLLYPICDPDSRVNVSWISGAGMGEDSVLLSVGIGKSVEPFTILSSTENSDAES